ncbi:MrcB family domain-containing protein [Micromonospora sp. NPDC051300]|uniref:MrcB family domain-containing protein n=1 Tax=Micromonospora sp. NPDC051300 TaxID=3364286 RepID=UPI0037A22084
MATASMTLVDYLQAVSTGYDPDDGFDTPQQQFLSRARELLGGYGPNDFVIKASGGQYPLGATDTPWIGFFDPDESVTPMRGLYVVWILQASREAWTLSVNMGTELRAKTMKKAGEREAQVLEALRAEAAAIRGGLPAELTSGWGAAMDLRRLGVRQRRYEAGTIIAKTYLLDALPDDKTLAADLDHACLVLTEATQVRDRFAIANPGAIFTGSAVHIDPNDRDLPFDPGADVATTINLPKRSIERKPRHEGGLRRYGTWLQGRDFKLTTKVHPRDFVITVPTAWIGEYKVVYGRDVARATREAHSQLKEYRHFLYAPGAPRPQLLAVFSAPITDRRVAWLNAEDIAVVWDEDDRWRGCPLAKAAGLGL